MIKCYISFFYSNTKDNKGSGFGSADITLSHKLSEFKDIEKIKNEIEKEESFIGITILNWNYLE